LILLFVSVALRSQHTYAQDEATTTCLRNHPVQHSNRLCNVGGPGDAWSPEHLLLASVAICFIFIFRAVAESSKFEFLSLELSGSGTVDRKDGSTRFTDIVLRSRLTLPKGRRSGTRQTNAWEGQKRLPCHCVTFDPSSFGKRNHGRVRL